MKLFQEKEELILIPRRSRPLQVDRHIQLHLVCHDPPAIEGQRGQIYIQVMIYCCQVSLQYLDELNFLVSERIFASSHLLLHQSDFLHLPGSHQFYHLKVFWRNLSGPIPRPYSSFLCSLKGEKVGKYRGYYFQGSNFQKTFHVNSYGKAQNTYLGKFDQR